ELPEERRALPVFKVLYRNTNQIHKLGCRTREVLRPVPASILPTGTDGGETLRRAVRRRDLDQAERTFAALARESLDAAYNDLQYIVQDNTDVHRVVLA